MDPRDLDTFEAARPGLLGLAYRILGSRADAEDAVQDCFLKWRDADRRAIERPAAWLTTVCTRRCLDLLRASHRARVEYVGPWLPEPIHTAAPAGDAELAASLTTAFLLMLERLTPRERAAYLLHEIFGRPYAEVAATLAMEEAACRKLVSRAKAHVDRDSVRHVPPPEAQDQLLHAFQAAITSGNPDQLAAHLAAGIRLTTDSGGKATAARRVLEGNEVLAVLRRAHTWWAGYAWTITDMNGGRGAILTSEGQPALTLSFGFDEDGRISDIYMVRNPDKLAHLDPVAID